MWGSVSGLLASGDRWIFASLGRESQESMCLLALPAHHSRVEE